MRSTLILSRKDGSIIKATGLIAHDTEGDAHQSRVQGKAQTSMLAEGIDRDAQNPQDDGKERDNTEPVIAPAQILAESIHTFVASASGLAESIGKIKVLANHPRTRNEVGRTESQIDESTAGGTAGQMEDEVQLLRLRLKKQEIIIYPDPQYLCCVIQDLEKGSR